MTAIFSQGDPADAVFYIQTGKVKLTVVSTSGKEAVIAYLPEKSFFGEGSIAGQQLRISTASALQSSLIVRIEKTVMLDCSIVNRSSPSNFSHTCSPATSAWKLIWWIICSIPAKSGSPGCC